MKLTQTSANFENAHIHLAAQQNMVSNMPARWQKKLQAVLNDGGFLKIEICLLAGGQIDSKLWLISNVGETLEIRGGAE